MAPNIEYQVLLHNNWLFWGFFGTKSLVAISYWYQIWSNDEQFENHHKYGHIGTDIVGVEVKEVCSRFFSMLLWTVSYQSCKKLKKKHIQIF